MNDISSFLKFLTNNYESTFKLSTFDIKLKYRRTLLGDYWSILTNIIALGIISIIWSVVFNGVFIKYFAMIFIGMTSFYMLISFISNSSEILYTTYKDDFVKSRHSTKYSSSKIFYANCFGIYSTFSNLFYNFNSSHR